MKSKPLFYLGFFYFPEALKPSIDTYRTGWREGWKKKKSSGILGRTNQMEKKRTEGESDEGVKGEKSSDKTEKPKGRRF